MKKSASFQTIVLLLLLCLAAPLSNAYAEIQGVATVIALRGTVVAQGKGGAARNLSIKSQIFQEDVLKTDKTGQLQIMFTDSSIISLGRDSEMKIAEYRWQPEQKDGALKTQAKEGTFRVMGGALAKDAPQNFKTETPTATIGIRGSMYAFKSTPDSLSVVFQGGKGIEVFNDLGKVAITVPGFGTHVVLNAPPAKPSKFTEQQLKNLNQGLNGNGGNAGGGSSGEGKESDNGTAPLSETMQQPPPPIDYVENVHPEEIKRDKEFKPPPPPPTDGIFSFDGTLGGVYTRTDPAISPETFTNAMSMGVNWHNHRIFGIAYEDSKEKPVFFFGSVNGSTVSDLTIFGVDDGYANTGIASINGEGVGVFAGAVYDFFAFGAQGNTTLIKEPTTTGSFTVAGGGYQSPGAVTPVAPKGTEQWQGFVTGLSIDMAAMTLPGMFQSGDGDFTLTVNKDAGTINGTLSAGNPLENGLHDGISPISGLAVGGDTSNSVYLRDDLMAALITTGAGSPSLKNLGNFMVVAEPSDQFSSYVTWGYWQIAYNDSGYTDTDRLMAGSHSLWIAGKPTSIGDMAALNGFKGTYTGKAFGTEFGAGIATPLSGTCTLNADFTNGWVDGNIILSGTTLPFPSVPIASNTFAGSITNGDNISGQINGGFFGPAAIAVGGNFTATKTGQTMPDTKQYIGIFGGNRGALSTSPVN